MSSRTLVLSRVFLLCLTVSLLVTGCNNDDPIIEPEVKLTSSYPNEVVAKWNDLLLEVERFTPGYLPPVSARAFAYIGLGAYETALPGMPAYQSLVSQYPGLELPVADAHFVYHYPTALNNMYATMTIRLYPTMPAAQLSKVAYLQEQLNAQYETEVTADVFNVSANWGKSIAEAVYEWSKSDVAGHEAYLRSTDPLYVPPAGPGFWQPTYPDFGKALLPYWGDVRLFAAKKDDQCSAPLPYSTDENSEFYVQARETENKVNLIRQGQNYEDKWIAEFWSDDCPARTFTPAGRWIAIAGQAFHHENSNLEKAVVVSAKLGMALCDAGIRCWAEKYRFNLLRPVDYIRDDMGHQEWNTIMCPDGSGQFFTPAFPTYPSGHGTFGAAAAEVLTDEFGYDFAMTDACHKDRTDFLGTPRAFQNFYEMAGENAYSRIPIGVHFRMDADAALELGYTIGRRVNDLPWK